MANWAITKLKFKSKEALDEFKKQYYTEKVVDGETRNLLDYDKVIPEPDCFDGLPDTDNGKEIIYYLTDGFTKAMPENCEGLIALLGEKHPGLVKFPDGVDKDWIAGFGAAELDGILNSRTELRNEYNEKFGPLTNEAGMFMLGLYTMLEESGNINQKCMTEAGRAELQKEAASAKYFTIDPATKEVIQVPNDWMKNGRRYVNNIFTVGAASYKTWRRHIWGTVANAAYTFDVKTEDGCSPEIQVENKYDIPIGILEQIGKDHPNWEIGFHCFEDFDDSITEGVIKDGKLTVTDHYIEEEYPNQGEEEEAL